MLTAVQVVLGGADCEGVPFIGVNVGAIEVQVLSLLSRDSARSKEHTGREQEDEPHRNRASPLT